MELFSIVPLLRQLWTKMSHHERGMFKYLIFLYNVFLFMFNFSAALLLFPSDCSIALIIKSLSTLSMIDSKEALLSKFK